MRSKFTLGVAIPAMALVLAFAGTANAQTPPAAEMGVCQQRLDEVRAEWKASPIPTSKYRAASSNSRNTSDRPAVVTRYMQGQLDRAQGLCKDGEEHESLLRLDLVRAWLKLPFEEHPASHNYHPSNKAQ